MPNETLNDREVVRFYRLRDSLAIAAHTWLGLEGDILPSGDPDLPDEEVMAEALRETWKNSAVIDRFVGENPAGFGPRDLAVVKSWKNALTLPLIAFEHAHTILFYGEQRIFHVTGLLEPLDRIVAEPLPLPLQTTLLPFEGRIVYEGFVFPMPVRMSDNMLKMINDEITDALKKGAHVSNADQFEEIAPVIAEERITRQADQMIEELELEMKANEQLDGHHAGVLAGLGDDERHHAVNDHVKGKVFFEPEEVALALKEDSLKMPFTRDLAQLLTSEKKDKLRLWASMFGAPSGSSRTKAQLASDIATDEGLLGAFVDIALESMDTAEFKVYRALYEAGGEQRVHAEEVKTPFGLPVPMTAICYLLYVEEDDSFTFVIPDQIMDILDEVDWDELDRSVNDWCNAVDIAEAVVELRGIATMSEVYAEFVRCHPETQLDEDSFDEALFRAANRDQARYDILNTGDEVYLLEFELGNRLREDNDIEVEEYPDPYLEVELGALRNLLDMRGGKVARTLDEEMRTPEAVFEWKLRRPAVRALRKYLDEHVPDSQDDYFFADSTIEELVDFMSFGMMSADSVRICFEILEAHGYVPDEAHMRRLLDLLMNMMNAIPTWTNNGWAPNELHEAATGQKVFYNEDGSVMKVGRNDPCPCGSGKKYKKCCGR